MPTIRVRALPGRVVYDHPRSGKVIPSDKFVSVPDSYYMRRMIEHWGDVELEGGTKEAAKPAPKAAAPTPAPAPAKAS